MLEVSILISVSQHATDQQLSLKPLYSTVVRLRSQLKIDIRTYQLRSGSVISVEIAVAADAALVEYNLTATITRRQLNSARRGPSSYEHTLLVLSRHALFAVMSVGQSI